METSQLICRANQYTGFYMIGTSFNCYHLKRANLKQYIRASLQWSLSFDYYTVFQLFLFVNFWLAILFGYMKQSLFEGQLKEGVSFRNTECRIEVSGDVICWKIQMFRSFMQLFDALL